MAEAGSLSVPAKPRDDAMHEEEPTVVAPSLVDLLLSTRDGWSEERTRHRFLLDAYAGTGGFQGRVRMPFRSFWGWAADVYRTDLPLATYSSDLTEEGVHTYLDRFHREDEPKFVRRSRMAHYPNYIAPFIDIPVSFMLRKPFRSKPDEKGVRSLGTWMEDADGRGTSWGDVLQDTIAIRAAVLGWCPVLFDLPGSGGNTALDDERDGVRPFVQPMFPGNLLDWSHGPRGGLRWAKTRIDYVSREDPLAPGREVTRITIWEPTRWRWWELERGSDGKAKVTNLSEGAHPFGEVPILICRRKPVPDDPFQGLPMASNASDEARRLFNYLSELDEHLRSCAFALLNLVTKDPDRAGSMLIGGGQALTVHPDWKNVHEWLMPDTGVATMYEKRIMTTIEEMFRQQKMEFSRGTKGGSARSGVSQAFEFEAANRAIADFARQIATFDQKARRLVSSALPGAPDPKSVIVEAPARFDVEEMAKELDEALSAVSLGLGPTAEAEVKKKMARQILPHVGSELREKIEAEIDAIAEEQRQADRDSKSMNSDAIREARQALKGNRDDPEDILDKRDAEDEEDEDEGGDE
jgi:hypothetical protein